MLCMNDIVHSHQVQIYCSMSLIAERSKYPCTFPSQVNLQNIDNTFIFIYLSDLCNVMQRIQEIA